MKNLGRTYLEMPILDHRRSVSLELQAAMFDGNSLANTKEIAPIISDVIRGSISVMDIGFGTGFRTLYYAINNPEIRFIAIDRNPDSAAVLNERASKLDVRNVDVSTVDFMDPEYRKTAQHIIF